jgi:hypothetical protein
VDLKNWTLSQGGATQIFLQTLVLHPGHFLILAEDTLKFKTMYPDFNGKLLPMRLPLNNTAGNLLLHNPNGKWIHSLRYSSQSPWPTLPNGHGATLELEPGTPGNLISEWRESYFLLGTPGQSNSLPPVNATVFINEILASNKQTLTDEWGEFDDYLELYNASTIPVQIGGWCFTDDSTYPCKSQLPLNHPDKTIIPPGGFLLLWADDQPEQGPLHLNFKLSANGERMTLTQRIGNTWLERDGLGFGQQQTDQSYGRFPDGSTFLTTMPPSPGRSNNTNANETLPLESIVVFPNPFAETFNLDASKIKSPCQIQCMNSFGQVIYHATDSSGTIHTISGTSWPTGIYFLRIIDPFNRSIVIKLAKH